MYLIWYSHKSQLPVGSPNSSCENVALYLSMGLTFIEQTVLWLKKRSNKKTTYYHNSPPSNHSSQFPLFLHPSVLSCLPIPPSQWYTYNDPL